MSKTGILKSSWIMINPAETRVIDSNQFVENKLREMSSKLITESSNDESFTDGFMHGIDAMRVAQLVGDEAMLNQFDSEKHEPTKEEIIQQANEEAEQIKQLAIVEAQQEKEKILQDAKTQGYNDGFEQGKKEGYEIGHDEGIKSTEDDRKKMMMEISVKAAMIEEEYHKKLDELEPQFVDLITGIYEHIFNISLKKSKEIVVYLIGNTLRNIEGNSGYLIHVSKEDYPYVSMQKKDLVNGTSISPDVVDIIEDATLSKSECTIETSNGVFDCSLGTQLEALNEELRLLSYDNKAKANNNSQSD